jgi:hypothetical protein
MGDQFIIKMLLLLSLILLLQVTLVIEMVILSVTPKVMNQEIKPFKKQLFISIFDLLMYSFMQCNTG